ncbi:MAG: hypothetical protein KF705_15140 [Phycisphaeraceae bacterium]|nr:hypothetical protein [Phycisphaeraceae bacterium]
MLLEVARVGLEEVKEREHVALPGLARDEFVVDAELVEGPTDADIAPVADEVDGRRAREHLEDFAGRHVADDIGMRAKVHGREHALADEPLHVAAGDLAHGVVVAEVPIVLLELPEAPIQHLEVVLALDVDPGVEVEERLHPVGAGAGVAAEEEEGAFDALIDLVESVAGVAFGEAIGWGVRWGVGEGLGLDAEREGGIGARCVGRRFAAGETLQDAAHRCHVIASLCGASISR